MPAMFDGFSIQHSLDTASALPGMLGAIISQRDPEDPLFFADVTIQNIAIGSRHWIAQASDTSNVLATGIAASSEVLIVGVPAYENPMLLEIRIRNSSGAPTYKPYETHVYLSRAGATAYVAQIVDDINT